MATIAALVDGTFTENSIRLTASLGELQAGIDKRLADAQEDIDDAKAATAQVRERAFAEAKEIVAGAKAQVEGVVAKAQIKASEIVDAALKRKADFDFLAEQASNEAGRLKAEALAAKDELAGLHAKISAAKEAMKKMLG